jgi:large subunit ribosomal protein L24
MQNPEGGLVRKEASIHMSNVAFVNPGSESSSLSWSAKNTTKIGFRWVDGVKMRYAKRSDLNIAPV